MTDHTAPAQSPADSPLGKLSAYSTQYDPALLFAMPRAAKRAELGIGHDDSPRIKELFTQTYQGSRFSFGYPACPDMSDQEKLFRLLQPERIGCVLTENWQIVPEQSTSAIVVHHPEAKYFNAT